MKFRLFDKVRLAGAPDVQVHGFIDASKQGVTGYPDEYKIIYWREGARKIEWVYEIEITLDEDAPTAQAPAEPEAAA